MATQDRVWGFYPETDEEIAEAPPGGFPPDAPHPEHFRRALKNALDKWKGGPTWVAVMFAAEVEERNPGWILRYAATLDSSGPTP